jgi:uncharacterized membrane protein
MAKVKEPKKVPSNFSIFGWSPSFVGLIFGTLFLFVSFLPSLLPRPWWLQGLICGLSVAIGYGLGVAISSLFRWFLQKEISVAKKKTAWQTIKIVTPLFAVLSLLYGIKWQNEVRQIVGDSPIETGYILKMTLMTILISFLLIKMARGIRRLARKLNKFFAKHVPIRLAVGLGLAFTVFIVYYIVSGLFISNFYKVADGYYGRRNDTAPEGIVQPTSPNRSGSPESLIPWEDIGFQGRGFVGSGPTKQDIEDYTKQPAQDPIRLYAGMSSAETAEERAQLIVEELKRTYAFERDVLVIATATGTGWLDPPVVDSLEYIHNGNTVIVSQQYSYLPSWISFLVDKDRAREAGRVLYDAVIEEWSKLPEDNRPKLLAYGLSLGSFGGQAAYSGINDIRRSIDGALFTGSPNDSEVWRKTTDNRDEGSPEWQPIYRNGESVRFASTREDILNNQDKWTDETRILFLQNANDPVVWFSFDLIFNKPDWLNETRGRGVSPNTRYFPIITFLQVTFDQAIAASAPIGHGHYYIDTPVYAWASVYAPEGWTNQKSDDLQNYLNNF